MCPLFLWYVLHVVSLNIFKIILYSDLLSFLLSLCTREHDTHLDVVNAQAP